MTLLTNDHIKHVSSSPKLTSNGTVENSALSNMYVAINSDKSMLEKNLRIVLVIFFYWFVLILLEFGIKLNVFLVSGLLQ
jgi:hypothetical protein